jgi:hypothetical protein
MGQQMAEAAQASMRGEEEFTQVKKERAGQILRK